MYLNLDTNRKKSIKKLNEVGNLNNLTNFDNVKYRSLHHRFQNMPRF